MVALFHGIKNFSHHRYLPGVAGSAEGNRSPYEKIADRWAHKRVVSFPLTDYTSFAKGGAAVHIKTATFIKSGTKPDHYPPEGQPEIAFAGRSNVGKSSLINVLVNRKNLVRTSSTPGRTQLVNFFEINGGEFTLVDLPGYGFAKVPLAVKAQWGPMMETYLATRKTLKCVLILHLVIGQDRQCLTGQILGPRFSYKCSKCQKTRRPGRLLPLPRLSKYPGRSFPFSLR